MIGRVTIRRPPTSGGQRLTWWLVMATLSVIITGMAYSFWWSPVVRHTPGWWITPGDIWYTVRSAHWVGWGSVSYVFSNNRTELVTLPGFELLLLPVVLLSSALGLSESAPGLIANPNPHAWLLMGPVTMACCALPLFAFDGLARHLGVQLRRRRLLAFLEAGALWPTVVVWGHPEYVLALGLLTYTLLKTLQGRLVGAGWLLGGALSLQLFGILMAPLLIGLVGLRKGAALVARAAIVPGAFLVAVLVPDFHDAAYFLLKQPAFPKINHPTPWVALAPRIGPHIVAGGVGRVFGLIVAVIIAVLAHRWRQDRGWTVWFAAAVLAIRCVFEPVMVPYYVMPAVCLVLVTGVTLGHWRLIITCVAGAALTVMTFTHHGEWTYWLLMVGLMAACFGVSWPGIARVSEPSPNPDPGGLLPREAVAAIGSR